MLGTILIAIIGVIVALHYLIKVSVTHKILKDVNRRIRHK